MEIVIPNELVLHLERCKDVMASALRLMTATLTSSGVKFDIEHRLKDACSAVVKAEDYQMNPCDLWDIIATRVVVHSDDEGDIYKIVKILEGYWFICRVRTDYLKNPKENGYRALHLSCSHFLYFWGAHSFEIQIILKSVNDQHNCDCGGTHVLYKDGGKRGKNYRSRSEK